MSWVKYKVQKKQEYIQGSGWQDVTPLETRYGEEIGIYNTFKECSGYDALTRWITEDINEEYICSGLAKYYKEIEQISYDKGETWQSFVPEISRVGKIYEETSADCLPSAGHYRAKIVLPDNSEYELPCTAITSSSTLTIQDWYTLASLSGITTGDIKTAKEMYIGDCITKIGVDSESGAGYSSDWPISDFTNLEFISMADSVTDIGNTSITTNNSLKSIKLSNNLKNIWPSAFINDNRLSSISLKEGLKKIYYNGLISYRNGKIKFPNSVDYLGEDVVNRFVTEIEIGSGLKTISYNTFENEYRQPGFAGYDKRYIYDRRIVFNPTTPPSISGSGNYIGDYFNSVFVPESSIETYKSAFGHSLMSAVYTSLNDYIEDADDMILTVASATSLAYLTIPYIHWRFPEIKSGKVTKENLGMRIRVNDSKPIKVWLSDKVTNIDNNAFGWPADYEPNMQSITIEATVPPTINKVYETDIDGILLNNLATYPIYVPSESVEDYKNSAGFYRYASRIQAIPGGIHQNDEAFVAYNANSSVALKIYRFDLSGTTIHKELIENKYSFTNAIIGSFVTEIENEAFSGCTNLTGITCLATTPPTLGTGVFNQTNNCPIYVPSGSVNAYKTASGWNSYTERLYPIPNS